jgi:hypothetical protein
MVDQAARKRIEALEAQGVQRDREIADLSGRLSRLAATLEAIRSSAPSGQSPASASTPRPAAALPRPPAPFASLIVSEFPALFAEFRGKRFTVLWRGSRDGFGARDFHGRCDGHANTLTLIEDTKGNIFGGFTPVEWDSSNGYKADRSLKSFLFTLKNPHNFRAKKFGLKAGEKDKAIGCGSAWGPHFRDIGVDDNCHANTNSCTYLFGDSYANDTGLAEATFLTGSGHFTVKEIEVFEITD